MPQSDRKIFGIGVGRSGSSSLAAALEVLGYRVVHFPHDEAKRELLAGRGDLSLLNSIDALIDGVHLFYPQLDRSNPGARFIMTTRDPDSWVQSQLRFSDYIRVQMQSTDPNNRNFIETLRIRTYGSAFPDERSLREGLERHEAAVQDYFRDRPEALLVMNIPAGDGWEKLSGFLGVDQPDRPFPRSNTKTNLEAFSREVREVWTTSRELTSPGERFLLLDNMSLGLHFDDRHAINFPDNGGEWAGPPATGQEACAAMTEALGSEVRRLVVASSADWWFDYYNGLQELVMQNFRKIHEGEFCSVWDRRAPAS